MPRAVVVDWVGDIDLATVAAERDRVDRLIASGIADPLCLDLGEVDFLDSSALGLLLHIREECEDAHVELRLTNISQRARRLFTVTGLAGLFTVDGERARTDLADLPASAPLPASSDPAFDDLAVLTTRVLDVPTATVTLVDQDGQIFPGASGLRQPYQTLRVTPLSHSLCRHVVAGATELVIPDLREDPGFANHPALLDMGVTAYAGTPIAGAGGQLIGSVCAMSDARVDWTPAQLKDLRLVARLASLELRTRNEIADERRTAERYRAADGRATQHLLSAGLLLTRALSISSGDVADGIRRSLEETDSALSALRSV